MSLKNWDNKTWLSSKKYIYFFNNFLLKHTKINRNSKILDIGCGRAKIIGSLSSKLKLKNKPIGIDVEKFKDIDRRINFKKIDAIEYCKRSEKFDLILIKQSIHLIRFSNIQRLLKLCKKNLNLNGRILIFSLDVNNNEIPTFKLMKKKLDESLKRDEKILALISRLFPRQITKKFKFRVKINKKAYLKMIKNRYMSILLSFKSKDIINGINEIDNKFDKVLKFNDKLICLIINR